MTETRPCRPPPRSPLAARGPRPRRGAGRHARRSWASRHLRLRDGETLARRRLSSPETSQHVTDWYTFSHVLHGFIFYAALWLVAPKAPIGRRRPIAVGVETGWEPLEELPRIVEDATASSPLRRAIPATAC